MLYWRNYVKSGCAMTGFHCIMKLPKFCTLCVLLCFIPMFSCTFCEPWFYCPCFFSSINLSQFPVDKPLGFLLYSYFFSVLFVFVFSRFLSLHPFSLSFREYNFFLFFLSLFILPFFLFFSLFFFFFDIFAFSLKINKIRGEFGC